MKIVDCKEFVVYLIDCQFCFCLICMVNHALMLNFLFVLKIVWMIYCDVVYWILLIREPRFE
jgi:hypothetical protein